MQVIVNTISPTIKYNMLAINKQKEDIDNKQKEDIEHQKYK
jgi:hypothetical protein